MPPLPQLGPSSSSSSLPRITVETGGRRTIPSLFGNGKRYMAAIGAIAACLPLAASKRRPARELANMQLLVATIAVAAGGRIERQEWRESGGMTSSASVQTPDADAEGERKRETWRDSPRMPAHPAAARETVALCAQCVTKGSRGEGDRFGGGSCFHRAT